MMTPGSKEGVQAKGGRKAERRITIDRWLGVPNNLTATFVSEAKRFQSEISVKKVGRGIPEKASVNAKENGEMLLLAARPGARIRIRALGSDSRDAVRLLAELVQEKPEDKLQAVSQEVVIRNSLGIHNRPTGRIVQQSIDFSSDILLEHDGRIVNCKSVMSVLTMPLSWGAKAMLHANGSDADAAMAALVALFESGFGED